jgi:hypothetical protein
MVKKMPKSAIKTPTFDVYKTIKDEIIEISELRFENILTKKLDKFRHEFKAELMEELSPRFEAINSRFEAINARFESMDARFESIDSKFDIIKWSIWSLPIIMTIIMALFAVILKYLI